MSREVSARLPIGLPLAHPPACAFPTRARLPPSNVQAQPFKFLNLGLLAYLGGGEAISQVQVGDQRLFAEAGSVGFLLWRSVYIAKQVRNLRSIPRIRSI